jgi:hypothetical protein
MEHERRTAGDVQHHDVLARHGLDPRFGAEAALGADVDDLLAASAREPDRERRRRRPARDVAAAGLRLAYDEGDGRGGLRHGSARSVPLASSSVSDALPRW